MARLKKRKNTWFADFYVQGKRIIKTTGVKIGASPDKTMIEAQTKADIMEKVARGEISLNHALDAVRSLATINGEVNPAPSVAQYLSDYKPAGKETNVKNYHRAAARFLDFLGNSTRRLDSITVKDCREWIQHELERVSYGTVKQYRSQLSPAFNAAVADDLIPKNPFSFVRMDKMTVSHDARAQKRLPFTSEEMHIILTTFASPWRELVAVSFLTGGQRIGDICCMKWSSIDFRNGIIDFNTRKTGKQITAPIIAPLRAILRALYKEGETYVFPDMQRRYTRSSGCVSIEFTAMLRAAGIITQQESNRSGDRRTISQKSFHSIRHTVVSMLRSSNQFTADMARAIVGHDSEEIERQYFTPSLTAKQQGLEYIFRQIAPTE